MYYLFDSKTDKYESDMIFTKDKYVYNIKYKEKWWIEDLGNCYLRSSQFIAYYKNSPYCWVNINLQCTAQVGVKLIW